MEQSPARDNFLMIATTFSGLEEVLAEEIKQLGGIDIEIRRRAVAFSGNTELMYRANFWLRTALASSKTPENFSCQR